MADLLTNYDALPKNLLSTVQSFDARASCGSDGWCGFDTTDCSQDRSCSPDCSDSCYFDTPLCNTDFPCRTDNPCPDSPCPDTPLVPATFDISGTTGTETTVYVYLGSGYSEFRIFVKTINDASWKTYDESFTRYADFSVTVGGLTPGKSYSANVCSIPASGQGGVWQTAFDFTTDGPTRPIEWSWWSSVGKGQPIAFTVAEWNAFYAKINAFLVYKYGAGHEWPNFIPVSKGIPLSAAIVNEARAAIASMTSAPMPPTAYPGVTPVSADYFIKLEKYLNSVV